MADVWHASGNMACLWALSKQGPWGGLFGYG